MSGLKKPTREILYGLKQPTSEFLFRIKKQTSDLESGIFRPRVSVATHAIAVIVGFMVVQISILLVLYNLSVQAELDLAAEYQARNFSDRLQTLFKAVMTQLPDSLEAYVYATSDTSRDAHVETYLQAKKTILAQLQWLEKNTEEEQEKKLVAELDQKVRMGINIVEQIRNMSDQQGMSAIQAMQARSNQLTPIVQELRDIFMELEAEHRALESKTTLKTHQERENKVRFAILLSFAFSILSTAAAVLYLKLVIGRLNIVVDNTIKLAEKQPLNERLSGIDEISELDRFFHRMTSKLEMAQKKERAVYEKALDIICTLDHNLCFSSANDSCTRYLGRTPQQLYGGPFVDIVHSRDRDDVASKLMILTRDARGDIEFEARMLKSDEQSFVHMVWTVHWSKEDGSLFCVGHDITDRKRLEEVTREKEKFVRQLIEAMPVGLIRTTRDGAIEFTNPTIEKVLGYTSSELVGKSLSTLLNPHGSIDFENVRKTALKKLVETSAYKKDRSSVPVEFSIESFETEAGPRDLAIFFDVTERQEVRKLRNQFVAMITHELRTPLTSIRGYLNLLSDGIFGAVSEEAADKAAKAEKNVDRLINLINDLLDLEKLEAGKMNLSLEITDLAAVVERSIDAVSSLAEKRKVKISADETDLEVVGDEGRLIQVLVNFLSNAIKYSPDGQSVKVKVSASGRLAKVSVTDRGNGIPEAYLNSIFERFQQAKGAKEGTGLGLAISKAIIEGHGGQVGVESREAFGSTFWFTVPLPGNDRGTTDEGMARDDNTTIVV